MLFKNPVPDRENCIRLPVTKLWQHHVIVLCGHATHK